MSRKSILIILSIVFIAIFLVCSDVKAILTPQVYFTELNIQKNSFEPGETIRGEVSLWNYENLIIGDLVFHFQLLAGEVNGVPNQMVDEQKGKEIFRLLPGEKTTKAFYYTLPANLPKGDFKFRVLLANNRGEEMSWIDKVISIGGEGKFLTLENYWIVKDGESLSPGGGVRYQPGEIPEVSFDVKNNSSFTITAFSKIFTYKRNVGEILREEKGEVVILKSGELKTQRAFLPELTRPESYLSEIRFYDADTQEPISNSIYFRWIVSGEDAEILFVGTDKTSYETGEEAKVEVQITGPPDYEIPGGEGTIEVKLFDQEGELVGEGEKVVELDSKKVIVDVLLEEDVDDPSIEVKIIKEGKTLDEYNSYVAPVEHRGEEKKLGFFERNKKLLIFAFISILIIVALIIYYLKTKKRKLPAPLILLAFLIGYFLFFGADKILAATEVTGGRCDTTVAWNSPLPDQTYNVGDIINFSGKFRVTGCGDGLFYNKIDFFITEDIEPKKPPLVEAGSECCLNCLGATSDIYGSCANILNLKWCDVVERLDESQPNVYKLATVFPPDVASGAKPYWVEYNQSFTIPEDLGFSGQVRFYAQYSGTHWKSHWHWNITYQKGEINALNQAPDAINLDANPEDCCLHKAIKGYFKWEFSDPDPGADQFSYEIEIIEDSSYNSGEVNTAGSPGFPYFAYVPVKRFPFNRTFNWRLKVEDDQGGDSGWIDGPPLQTGQEWPWPEFSWTPSDPKVGQEITFTNTTQYCGGASYPDCSYSWDLGDGSTSADFEPTHSYPKGGYEVTLTVQNDIGLCTTDPQAITVEVMPLPKWKEIAPF